MDCYSAAMLQVAPGIDIERDILPDMEFNPVFKRRVVRRKGFVTVSIPPQLAALFGECEDVVIRANLTSGGLIIEPLDK